LFALISYRCCAPAATCPEVVMTSSEVPIQGQTISRLGSTPRRFRFHPLGWATATT
jgi:hypothetical protein